MVGHPGFGEGLFWRRLFKRQHPFIGPPPDKLRRKLARRRKRRIPNHQRR